MMKEQSSIQSKFLNKMLIIVFAFMGLWSLIWIYGEYTDFKTESEYLRLEHVDSQKLLLKEEVNRVVIYINDMNAHADQKLEILLKERVYEAHQIAKNIYQQNINNKDLPEIKKMIKDALRPIRFNQNHGYYFAVSMNGIEQLYPIKPEFEGRNVFHLKDSKGNYVIQDEIKIIEQQGEGFVKHFWMKPGKESTKSYPKLSFVKYFKPLNWYLGSGEYLDKAKEQVQEEILRRLSNQRFGTEGYFFGSTYQGEALFSKGKITTLSSNIWELTDTNGVKIIQEQIKTAKNPEGGFVHYSWNKLITNDLSPKVSFVRGIPEWGWVIGAGVYLDTIEATIFENRAALIVGVKKRIVRSMVILAALLCLIYFWSRRISNQIQKSVDMFLSFLEKARTDSIFINPEDIQLKEFKDIAVSTNKMLEEKRKASEQLRKSEEKFRSAFHTNPDSINLNSLENGVYIEINEGFSNIMGYSREDIIGKSAIDMNIWDDLKDRDRLISGLKKNGIVENLEAAFRRKDGQIKIGLMSARLITIEDKDIILSITRDITERTQMEADRGRFLMAIEQSAEGIVITDIDGKIEYSNPSFEVITGYSTQEVLRQNLKILKSGEHDESFYHKMWETITSGNTWKGRLINKKKNGTLYTEEATISPVFDKTGEVINFVAVKRDITDEIRVEKQLEQSQKMESIGTLAGGIAHDFNNILFPILGHTEMLLQDISDKSSTHDSLQQIYSASIRARELVKQILTFSRQENSELIQMKMQPIIKEALKLIRSTIPTTIDIKQNIDPKCGIIKGDPTQIHQIIMNFSTNAYHAMEETGGELIISLKEIKLSHYDTIKLDIIPGNYACLTIADTGKGMNKELTKKIFDPFFTTKEKGKGTGMGLSVVHGIVKSMNGAIQVDSEPGKGTQFYVYLPLKKNLLVKHETRSKAEIQRGTEQILLVDDEEAILIMEKEMLERLGYHVTSRTSSIEALEAFRDSPNKFNLVITDMAMPNMPGDKLSAELTKIRPDIPVLLCTGFSETMSEEKAASLGINGFLLKPIVMKDLSQKIREVLDK